MRALSSTGLPGPLPWVLCPRLSFSFLPLPRGFAFSLAFRGGRSGVPSFCCHAPDGRGVSPSFLCLLFLLRFCLPCLPWRGWQGGAQSALSNLSFFAILPCSQVYELHLGIPLGTSPCGGGGMVFPCGPGGAPTVAHGPPLPGG